MNGITPYELATKANDDIKECFGIDIENTKEANDISSQVSITTTDDDNLQPCSSSSIQQIHFHSDIGKRNDLSVPSTSNPNEPLISPQQPPSPSYSSSELQVHLTQKTSPPPPPPTLTTTKLSDSSSLVNNTLIPPPPPQATIIPSSFQSTTTAVPSFISPSSSNPLSQLPASSQLPSSSSLPIPSLPARPLSMQLSSSFTAPSCSPSRPSSIQINPSSSSPYPSQCYTPTQASSTLNPPDRQSLTPVITETPQSVPEKPQPEEKSQSKDYSQCKTVNELLECLGLQEYETNFAQLPVVEVRELFNIEEDKLKTFMKFGHRKMLLETLRQIDPLHSFLVFIGHLDYYDKFKELGFDSIWSLLGITKECQKVFKLNDEEMNQLLEKKEIFMKDNTPDIDNMKEFVDLKEDLDSKPILRILFSEETTTRLTEVII